MSNIQAGGAAYKLSLQDDLTRDLKSALTDAAKSVRGVVGAIDAEVKKIGRSIQGLGKQLAGLGAGTAAFSAAATFGFAKATIAAGDFAETVNMFEAVFKDQTNAVRAWGKEYAKQVGRSESQLMRFLAEAQDTFVPLGFDRKEAAEFSKTITRLAIDLGSFKNIDDGEALRRLLGGVIGNTENLRAFGVVAQEAQIKAQALSMGFDPNNLTAYQKAMAILEITVAGTADAQGDAIKTAGSFANSVKALKASIGDLVKTIGGELLGVGTALVQAITSVIQSISGLLKQFPLLTKAAAAAVVAMGAVGAAATAMGAAIAAVGSSVAALGVGLGIWVVRVKGLTGAVQLLVQAAKSFGSLSFSGGGLFSLLKGLTGIGGIIKTVIASFKLLARIVMGSVGRLGAALTGPWAALAAVVAGVMKLAEGYYVWQQKLEGMKGKGLEQERRVALGRTYADMGLTGQDVTKTFNPNGARVAPGAAAQGLPALTEAQRGLAEEINAIRSPLELFRENVQNAAELLKRGEISQGQFDAYKKQQFDQFRQSDPQTQARDSLIEQLKTPAEQLKQAIRQARMLFADDAKNFGRAVRAAVDQFKATDPAEQLKQQLMTPLEIFRQSVAQARQLFADSPEFLKRAMAAAAETYKASIQQPKDDPAVKAAERIKQALRSDAQKVADQIAQAAALVKRGLLSGDQAKQFGQKLIQDYMGENPAVKELKQFATTSAAIASNIGAFAPSFDNTASEEKAYRKKALELQREIRDALRNQNPVFS